MTYTMNDMNLPIAFFISSHGYGHAARASAIMEAILSKKPECHFHIFTLVPEFFFNTSVCRDHFTWHPLKTDIGLVQPTPFHEDLPATIDALDQFLPFDEKQIEQLADKINSLGCQWLFCDISPLGLAVSKKAETTSLLIENFSWDWIYQGYVDKEPRFNTFIQYLSQNCGTADYHIQTRPYCKHDSSAHQVSPVSRKPRNTRNSIREQLGISADSQLVLISFGGVKEKNFSYLKHLTALKDIIFLIPGASDERIEKENLILLPHHSEFYLPDLTHAADLMVGKLGYSTLAETYAANIPFVFIQRNDFRENRPLSEFVLQEMQGLALAEKEFQAFHWIDQLNPLLDQSNSNQRQPLANGADQVAELFTNQCKV